MKQLIQFIAALVIGTSSFAQHQGLLFGSKICAAFDKQHPRELFNVQILLNEGGISDEVKEGNP